MLTKLSKTRMIENLIKFEYRVLFMHKKNVVLQVETFSHLLRLSKQTCYCSNKLTLRMKYQRKSTNYVSEVYAKYFLFNVRETSYRRFSRQILKLSSYPLPTHRHCALRKFLLLLLLLFLILESNIFAKLNNFIR